MTELLLSVANRAIQPHDLSVLLMYLTLLIHIDGDIIVYLIQ